MWQQLAPAFRMTLLLTVLTGLIYPGVVTGLCQVLFNKQAHGSLISQNGQVVGSRLLGQNFAKPEYFHPRPSAAGNDGYDPTASSGSNLGPTNQKLYDRMKAAAAQFHKDNPTYTGAIPADALTASGSGLDPEISVANAEAQAARVADARKASPEQVLETVRQFTAQRDLAFLGEARVNVLELNLALDQKYPAVAAPTQPPVK
jgi:potassium-transporting ATPase KdpC subunit